MDGAHLYRISLKNFRSIDRKVEVRLNSPVVLIHGQNGVGKTSLLSAIELALTGAIPSMERADPDYNPIIRSNCSTKAQRRAISRLN